MCPPDFWTSSSEEYAEDSGYTPTLFRKQRNPLLAKVGSKKKTSKDNWLKIRKMFHISSKENLDKNDDHQDVGFFSFCTFSAHQNTFAQLFFGWHLS